MINISRVLRDEVTDEMIEVSERLGGQASATPAGFDEKKKAINEEIWIAKQGYDKSVTLGNASEAREMAVAWDQGKKKLAALEYQRSHPRDEAKKEIESINVPLIERGCFFIDQEIDRLHGQRILRVNETLMTDDPLIQGVIRIVETNRRDIGAVRESLVSGKSKLMGMQHSSISQILLVIEDLEVKVNSVNLKQCEEVQMRDSEYHDELGLMETSLPPTIFNRKYHKAAERGFLEDQFDDIKRKVKKVIGR